MAIKKLLFLSLLIPSLGYAKEYPIVFIDSNTIVYINTDVPEKDSCFVTLEVEDRYWVSGDNIVKIVLDNEVVTGYEPIKNWIEYIDVMLKPRTDVKEEKIKPVRKNKIEVK